MSHGNNVSLLTLNLDYNPNFGSSGVKNLCIGLRTNRSLKQLHMQFCNIDSEAGPYLADVLANKFSRLEVLDLSGNKLRGIGLSALCKGLAVNSVLTSLLIADNMIEQSNDDLDGLTALKDCLMLSTSSLTSVDLMFNRIGILLIFAPQLLHFHT